MEAEEFKKLQEREEIESRKSDSRRANEEYYRRRFYQQSPEGRFEYANENIDYQNIQNQQA